MSEAIKAQAQKVVEARKQENAAFNKQRSFPSFSPEREQIGSEFESASFAVQRAERALTNLVIKELFGEVTY